MQPRPSVVRLLGLPARPEESVVNHRVIVSASLALGLAWLAPAVPRWPSSVAAAPVTAARDKAATQGDLDAFMAQVLEKRDENWKKVQQYILAERERVQVGGLGGMRLFGFDREYQWFIRDGFFVRSPVKSDGAVVPEAERRKYEADFLKRAQEREKRKEAADAAAKDPNAPPPPQSQESTVEALLGQTRQPQFIDTAYFLNFKFDQGRYALVGREKFADREVLKIEYYPAKLFNDDEANPERKKRNEERNKSSRDFEKSFDHLMNKNSVVTIWVEPATKQIVKYVFDNVRMDFLPAAWIVRVDEMQASMTMGEPFKTIWLPRDVEMKFAVMLASGPMDMTYRVEYFDYKEAQTSGRIKGRGGNVPMPQTR
jgi:hypothetical protein